MTKKSRPLNLDDFDAIDWDPEDDPDGNHAHCAEHGVDERVVDEVLGGDWVSIQIPLDTPNLPSSVQTRGETLCGPCSSTRLGSVATGFGR